MEQETDFSIEPCNKENIERIVQGINEYNLSKVPTLSETWTPLEFVAKDNQGIEVGGLLAGIGYWNGLEIKTLWVKDSHRNQGIGTTLLKHAEQTAKDKGATLAILDTFDSQAEGFYIKNNYESFGEIKDFPKGQRRICFSKKLA